MTVRPKKKEPESHADEQELEASGAYGPAPSAACDSDAESLAQPPSPSDPYRRVGSPVLTLTRADTGTGQVAAASGRQVAVASGRQVARRSGTESTRHRRKHNPQARADRKRADGVRSSPDLSDLEAHRAVADGYNSGDEYQLLPPGSDPRHRRQQRITEEQWQQREAEFESQLRQRGLEVRRMAPDGACLFRAVADQVFGDQEMHLAVRRHCINYIEANADYFSQYVAEDFGAYLARKRQPWVHGNHVEIQALSEMYNREVEVLCYSTEPLNIFHPRHTSRGANRNDPSDPDPSDPDPSDPDPDQYYPIRLSYHRGVHYNSVVDPHRASVGVGLGLPGLRPGQADRDLLSQASQLSEQYHIEQTLLEERLRYSDWEATDEALAQLVAVESYKQWLKDKQKHQNSGDQSPVCESGAAGSLDHQSAQQSEQTSLHSSSPVPAELLLVASEEDEVDVLAQVLAASRLEYLNSLKTTGSHQRHGAEKTDTSDSG